MRFAFLTNLLAFVSLAVPLPHTVRWICYFPVLAMIIAGAQFLLEGPRRQMIPVFRFPRPTGPYEMGTLTYHWVDTGRPEVFTAADDDQRELMARVWYPAAGNDWKGG